jgi:hypothetical protein
MSAALMELGDLITSLTAQTPTIRNCRKQYVNAELANHIVVVWIRAPVIWRDILPLSSDAVPICGITLCHNSMYAESVTVFKILPLVPI